MQRVFLLFACAMVILSAEWTVVRADEPRSLALDDMHLLRAVTDPQISPDGAWVAYVVGTHDLPRDKRTTDIWMTSWDGDRTVRLTNTPEPEHGPRWSPDAKYLSFLSGRGNENEIEQLWLMNRAGGEAEKTTDFKGGVVDHVWSPDGKRLVLVVQDPDPNAMDAKEKDKDKKTQKPIVIDRFYFKEDKTGYLTGRRQHLYLFDLAKRTAECLTPGTRNEWLPAWSPDGATIAYVTKAGADFDRHDNYDIWLIEAKAGAAPRQLTRYEGADARPAWESRPAWSPDGKQIAYVRGGEPKMIYYAIHQLAVVPVAGGPERLLAPTLDRNTTRPRWSADGKSIYFLLEDDQNINLSKIASNGGPIERVLAGRRETSNFDLGAGDKIAVVDSTPDRPAEILAFAGKARPLSKQNDELFGKLKLGEVEEIRFSSADGTEIHGFVVKPPDYEPGKKYPTILCIHGGPVGQFSNEFMFDWQLFAARGYVVVAANPRGSSGRGHTFSKAIYADWGNVDRQDVLAAVDHAVERGIADPGRLGVGGWSYGGILTNYTIVRDRRFKAAVSGASASNLLAGYGTDMYVREYEAELGTPWGNRDVWIRLSAPFLEADKIVTPTLFLCGDKDFNVPLLNSEQMYQALRSLGRDTQLVIYPGECHDLDKPSYRQDRLQRYLEWYDKHLSTQDQADRSSTK
jgi:dipeptidyl aminopeptidase/acylaminoacyl peptidase